MTDTPSTYSVPRILVVRVNNPRRSTWTRFIKETSPCALMTSLSKPDLYVVFSDVSPGLTRKIGNMLEPQDFTFLSDWSAFNATDSIILEYLYALSRFQEIEAEEHWG